MDILNPTIPNTPRILPRVSILSPKYSITTLKKNSQLRFTIPFSKSPISPPFSFYPLFSNAKKFRISAHFGRHTGYRRNSLREKLTEKQQVRNSPAIYEPSSDFENPVDKFDTDSNSVVLNNGLEEGTVEFNSVIAEKNAHFGRHTGNRRNSLRKKLVEQRRVRQSPEIYERTSDFQNPMDKLDTDSNAVLRNLDNDALKDGTFESKSHLGEGIAETDSLRKLKKDSVMLKQLESWAEQYKADSEFWGVGSGPIFTVFQDSDGKVERVTVNEDEILRRSGVETSLYKKSKSEDFKEAESKISHARSIARETELGNHVFKNSSVAKFVVNSSGEIGFVYGVKGLTLQRALSSRTSRIGIGLLCCSFVFLTLKWLFSTVKNSKKMRKYTPLQKEILRRKIKARMDKENLVKGSVEVLQDREEPHIDSTERPHIDRQEIVDSIMQIEASRSQESVDFDNKIEEIRVMARHAREIEKKGSLRGDGENDQTTNTMLEVEVIQQKGDNDDEEDEKKVIVKNSDSDGENDPTANELSNEKIVVEENGSKKMIMEVPNDSVSGTSILKAENNLNLLEKIEVRKSSGSEKNNGREKPRVIGSVKEAREYLALKRKENNQEPQFKRIVEEVDSVLSLETEKEKESDEKNKIPISNGNSDSTTDNDDIEADLNKENWVEKNLDEFEPVAKKIGVGFKENNQESQFRRIVEEVDSVLSLEAEKEKESDEKNKIPISNGNSDSTTDNDDIEEDLNKENWVEKNLDEFEPVAKKIGVGFKEINQESQFRRIVEEVESVLSAVNEKESDVKNKLPISNGIPDSATDNGNNAADSNEENWMEKNIDEFEGIVKKIGVGFKENYMVAKEKANSRLGSNMEMIKPKSEEDDGELDWMKDEKLREIVFQVRENELLGRDPFYLMDVEDKNAFFKGLEKKVDKMNEKLQPLHEYLHANIENLDYGSAGVSVYDPPEKIIPRWKGPPLDSTPEFLNDYVEQRNALVSQNLRKIDDSKSNESLTNTSTTSDITSPDKQLPNKDVKNPKTVIEGSDGSVKAGKKSGKEYWAHTKKWSRDFLDSYNAETDPEVKAVMRDIGKDLDRWITEEEVKEAATLMDRIPKRRRQIIEAKLHNFKREMNTYGPQAVVNKYSEYEEEKEEDYFWWLDLPFILCIELHTNEDGVEEGGFYSLEMAAELELKPKQYHVIGFQDIGDCKNLCYIIQSHMEMQGTGNAFVVARPPKEAYREAKANGYGVTVIKKGEIVMNVDQTLDEVEEQIMEIGTKMYQDKITKGRSLDINSLMNGVFGTNKKTNKTSITNQGKQSSTKRKNLKQKVKQLKQLEQKLKQIQLKSKTKPTNQ